MISNEDSIEVEITYSTSLVVIKEVSVVVEIIYSASLGGTYEAPSVIISFYDNSPSFDNSKPVSLKPKLES